MSLWIVKRYSWIAWMTSTTLNMQTWTLQSLRPHPRPEVMLLRVDWQPWRLREAIAGIVKAERAFVDGVAKGCRSSDAVVLLQVQEYNHRSLLGSHCCLPDSRMEADSAEKCSGDKLSK